MTGIERLRTLAGAWDEWGLGGALAEIADEIERERAEDCYRMGLDCGTVWRVVADMERHCLGHEGMEDSPVARWARELREALKSDTSDAADTQNPSCTGTAETAGVTSEDAKVTREDREAIAWVREHGGIESVKAQRRESMPRAAYERKKAGFLDHIAECETALGRRREIISKLGHRVSDLTRENAELRRRAMPEGVKWPRYESGELVDFGDEASRLGEVFSISLYCDGSFALNFRAYSKGERVKRPTPKVLDADGVEVEVGDDLYSVEGMLKFHVSAIDKKSGRIATEAMFALNKWADPKMYTHRTPILAADGEPLEVGQTVYSVNDGTEYKVGGIRDTEDVDGDACKIIECSNDELHIYYACIPPDKLTHTKPEIDSWERIEEDKGLNPFDYCKKVGHKLWTFDNAEEFKASDLVRRCRALAEREGGE